MSGLVGIDEAGRGALAGPLVAAAVWLPEDFTEAGLVDSKLIGAASRLRARAGLAKRFEIGIGWAGPGAIDELGLTEATRIAMSAALSQIRPDFNSVIIDGPLKYIEGEIIKPLIGGDRLVPAVSAASIVAKTARDAYMRAISSRWQSYGFSRHVGYGTAMHLAALRRHGPCELHRRSFAPVARVISK
jgi:ribonuclease HII